MWDMEVALWGEESNKGAGPDLPRNQDKKYFRQQYEKNDAKLRIGELLP